MVFLLLSATIWDEATGNGYLHDRAGTGTGRDLWHGWSMDVHHSRRGFKHSYEHLLFQKIQKYVERKSVKWDGAASEIEEAALSFL